MNGQASDVNLKIEGYDTNCRKLSLKVLSFGCFL